jgi:hypothetical protein
MPTLKGRRCCPARVNAGRGEDVTEDPIAAISPHLTERFNRFGMTPWAFLIAALALGRAHSAKGLLQSICEATIAQSV